MLNWKEVNERQAAKDAVYAKLLNKLHAVVPDSQLIHFTSTDGEPDANDYHKRMVGDRDIPYIADRGTVMSDAKLKIFHGRSNRCHQNVACLWIMEKAAIATGFRYFKGPGNCWTRHSWGMNGKRIVETTVKDPNSIYFGTVLDWRESQDFVLDSLVDYLYAAMKRRADKFEFELIDQTR
jgi:hypothetical protein